MPRDETGSNELRDCASRTAQQVVDLSASMRDGFREMKDEAGELDDRVRGVEAKTSVIEASRSGCIEHHKQLREAVRVEAATDRAAIRKEFASALKLCQAQRQAVGVRGKVRQAVPTVAAGGGAGGIIWAILELLRPWIEGRGAP